MRTWFKSLLDDLSAGTLLVMVSLSVVLALMFALGEIASRQADVELTPGAFPTGSHRDSSPVGVPIGVAAPEHVAPHGSVSVMVPVGAIR